MDNNVTLQEDRQEIEDFLELQPEEVKADCKIVSSQDIGQDFMLRIDKQTPEKFVPNMPKSAMATENTNTPRVTVAPTLVGCMIGYFRIERDVQDGTAVPAGQAKPKFAGGYSISRLKFDHCLKPGAKMVVDSDSSDEHWLVPYKIDAVEYDPDVVGQIFVESVTYLSRSNHWPAVRLNLYLRVDADDIALPVMPGKTVGKGFYRYTVFWPNIRTRTVQDEKCLLSLTPIDEADYLAAKKLNADMLSFKDRLPGFSAW